MSVPRASHSQSNNGYVHIEGTATLFRLCILAYSEAPAAEIAHHLATLGWGGDNEVRVWPLCRAGGSISLISPLCGQAGGGGIQVTQSLRVRLCDLGRARVHSRLHKSNINLRHQLQLRSSLNALIQSALGYLVSSQLTSQWGTIRYVKKAWERYGRHEHARLVPYRSYAQGVQCFRRGPVLVQIRSVTYGLIGMGRDGRISASSITCWLRHRRFCVRSSLVCVSVHWLLLQRAASVTPHLTEWHSLLDSLQVCCWLRVVQGEGGELFCPDRDSSPTGILSAASHFAAPAGTDQGPGVMIRLFASHQGESRSIPGGIPPGFPHVGIVPNDAAGRRVFSGISSFSRPRIPALLHTQVASPLSADWSLNERSNGTSINERHRDGLALYNAQVNGLQWKYVPQIQQAADFVFRSPDTSLRMLHDGYWLENVQQRASTRLHCNGTPHATASNTKIVKISASKLYRCYRDSLRCRCGQRRVRITRVVPYSSRVVVAYGER
ncbi:hypothetical protein PR048_018971 [Dryococelus australis]|uniref:Uncharacterized protein n=1 Tax=Dryococelus australis TaxID=614101 RepID=A0ABQ9H2I4_9NEOP|nr:hypothetical protein PR048_018971 [Dryococelus australis]